MTTWLFLLLCWQGAGIPETTAALSAIDNGRPAGPAQIQLLNRALDHDLTEARRAGNLTPLQRDAFSRASSYLSGIGVTSDWAMRAPMAQAWRRVGEGMELGGLPYDRSGALAGYRNSFIWMEQFPGQNPDDPSLRGNLFFVAGRVRALGGTIPVWVNVPIGQQAQPPRGIPDEYLQPPPNRTEMPAPVEIPKEGMSAEERQTVRALEQRFNGATVSVMAARSVVESLRQRLDAQGLQLNTETFRRYQGMLASYEQARSALNARRWDDAAESVDIAIGYARKILGEMGR
jgi:hypothetical protein